MLIILMYKIFSVHVVINNPITLACPQKLNDKSDYCFSVTFAAPVLLNLLLMALLSFTAVSQVIFK
jgi:hypothetical protein